MLEIFAATVIGVIISGMYFEIRKLTHRVKALEQKLSGTFQVIDRNNRRLDDLVTALWPTFERERIAKANSQ